MIDENIAEEMRLQALANMESRTCRNCKYWAGQLGDRYGDCNSPKMNGSLKGTYQDDGIIACDGESGDNSFESGPDFGCIHFSPKL